MIVSENLKTVSVSDYLTHLITAELHQETLEHRQIDTKLRGV